MYENRTTKHVEIVLGERGYGVNLMRIYKHISYIMYLFCHANKKERKNKQADIYK
jgi:hypothetical protein